MLFVQIKNMKKGFTLFELLVSISIIGILVAVASTSYGAAQKKARDARRMEDLNGIQKALEQYSSANSYNYPVASGGLPTGLTPNYMQNWPKDPKTGLDYVYTSANTSTYCVGVSMDNPTGNCSDINCGTFVALGGSHYCVKNQQ